MIEATREMFNLLGIDERRLHLAWISASEGALFAETITAFTSFLKELGEPPLQAAEGIDTIEPPADKVAHTLFPLREDQTDYCVECSICTGTCPVSRELPEFAPKQFIKWAVMKMEDDLVRDQEIWSCLSCAHCSVRCPAMIDFPEFNRVLRKKARQAQNLPQESHHGIQQAMARLQTRAVKPNRTTWAEQTGEFRQTGDYFYFVGCLPYFEITFRYLDLNPLTSAHSVLRVLNRIGIEPVISNQERCCGHDAFWSGDEATFKTLARHNIELIRSSGAKYVLFSCPEGYMTFKTQYPRFFGQLPFEILYLTAFLERELRHQPLPLRASANDAITFQDPCRLGRWSGDYDSPRHILQRIPATRLIEMERSRENALCCGTSAWMACGHCSKAIQTQRLHEAAETGAETLITACPKCQIHLTCALNDLETELQIKDIYTYLDSHIK